MQVNGFEGDFPDHEGRHQNHSGNPKKQNVIPGFHHVSRMKFLEIRTSPEQFLKRDAFILSQIRINQGTPCPKCRRKPGVQGIRILFPPISFRSFHGDLQFILTVKSWNPVPPPDLSTDAPVTKIFNPVKVGTFKSIRNQPDVTGANHINENFSQARFCPFPIDGLFIDINEPLFPDLRLDGPSSTTVK